MDKKRTDDLDEKEIKANDSEPENGEELAEITGNEKSDQGETTKEVTDEDKGDEQEIIKNLEEKVKNLEDSLLRKIAEFENYKRRTENDQLNLLKYAAESFILKILPVYDDLRRSVDHLDESNIESLKEGLKLVLNKFNKVFDDQGIKKMEVKGKEFDVEYHEALMQQPSKEVPSNTILEEIDAGYMYKDKVIRHAKVIVSQQIAEPEQEENDLNNDIEE